MLALSSQGDVARSHNEFRASRPAPYRDSPFFSSEFIEESLRQPGTWITPPGTRLVLPGDFSGKYFNIAHGMRRTTDQPADYDCRILLFGGSTIYSSEVPDGYTIASYLQRRINSRSSTPCIVDNYGTTSVTIAQQLERLKTVTIRPSDIVVFYDGVNEIFQGIYFNNPEGWIVGQNREALARLNLVGRPLIEPLIKNRERSALLEVLARRIFDPSLGLETEHLFDPGQLRGAIKRTTEQYLRILAESQLYVRSKGARFVHFLQPNLFSQNTFSDYEQKLINNPFIVPRGQHVAFREGTVALRAAGEALAAKNVESIDISHILGAREQNQEFFLDVCHVTEQGNAIIAASIYDFLF